MLKIVDEGVLVDTEQVQAVQWMTQPDRDGNDQPTGKFAAYVCIERNAGLCQIHIRVTGSFDTLKEAESAARLRSVKVIEEVMSAIQSHSGSKPDGMQ